ncbi:hypothetical protein GCM10011409_44520 [Lentibacillus populi]|uniref:Uncharacterized protein n=1 Tax=Lentibacillus populi TaxID=1827502 RepID=A0A9W5X856_9BACI|nr:hypothetical protein GCM10011409_44520 [Lentibacillus populi]
MEDKNTSKFRSTTFVKGKNSTRIKMIVNPIIMKRIPVSPFTFISLKERK